MAEHQSAQSSGAAAPSHKPQRVLACILCQQRKIKCDRRFPCQHCTKAGIQCVPAALAPRQRRRRFPERDLLERLRHYEDLLRGHGIDFEPMHPSSTDKSSPSVNPRNSASPRSNSQEADVGVKTEPIYDAKNFWNAMNQKTSQDAEDESDDAADDADDFSAHRVREEVVKVYDHIYEGNQLLFGMQKTNVPISTLHPDQIHILKLWQIYTERVEPLVKVVHTPSLQSRIVDATSNVEGIDSTLEALMFSIYSITTLALEEDECLNIFALPKADLTTCYQFGCQQALLNCDLLRTDNRECLTALYLYLVSVKPSTDPRSLSSTLGIAVRVAQRMGLDSEAANCKQTPFEAEMRRRLWWSLAMFDARLAEMSIYKQPILTPSWDCRTPQNVNDSDLRPEMKMPPTVLGGPTEALFTVVRSEICDLIRHSQFHLDFTNPSLKAVAKRLPNDGDLGLFEKGLEDRCLKYCDPENPLHYMTIWTARNHMAKCRLIEQYSKAFKASDQTDAQRNAANEAAQDWIESDTRLRISPLCKGFMWYVGFYFPFPAYIHMVQDLKRRPVGYHADRSWEAMTNNYNARYMASIHNNDSPFFKIFGKHILQAWEARERLTGVQLEQEPRIVTDVRRRLSELAAAAQESNILNFASALDMNSSDTSRASPSSFHSNNLNSLNNSGSMNIWPGNFIEQPPMEIDVNQLDWTNVPWQPMSIQGWPGT